MILFFNDLLPYMVMSRDTDSLFLKISDHDQIPHKIAVNLAKFGVASAFRTRAMTS